MQNDEQSTNKRRKLNNKHFKEQIWPLKDNWIFISYEEIIKSYSENLDKSEDLSERMLQTKAAEPGYKEDPKDLAKRLATGNTCEAIIASIYKQPYDDSDGPSEKYKKPDIGGVFGVKSSSWGNCALVYQEPLWPELIVVKDFRKLKRITPGIYICGLATTKAQMKYSAIDRMTNTDAYFKKNYAKTGFFGYSKLIPVHEALTLPKIKALIRQHEAKRFWMWLKENKARLEL